MTSAGLKATSKPPASRGRSKAADSEGTCQLPPRHKTHDALLTVLVKPQVVDLNVLSDLDLATASPEKSARWVQSLRRNSLSAAYCRCLIEMPWANDDASMRFTTETPLPVLQSLPDTITLHLNWKCEIEEGQLAKAHA